MPKPYLIANYLDTYGSIMQFNKNKNTYIHGWYPFVEGYSKEFILSIVDEFHDIFGRYPTSCLEPFAGSGTTPLELQKLGIKCFSFEVSPFMYNLSLTKMATAYTIESFKTYCNQIQAFIENCPEEIEIVFPSPTARTIVEKDGLKKWNFNKDIMRGILDIKYAIRQLNNNTYENLFKLALASILLEVSNVYRNGKCISYKKNWENTVTYSRNDVHLIYMNKLKSVFYNDIEKLDKLKKENGSLFSNNGNCYFGDVRKLLSKNIDDNSIELVITSPPYLNSRDYTDTYIIELRMLDYVANNEDLRNLRRSTLRSHVQIKWDDVDMLDIDLLNIAICEISKNEHVFWNKSLLNMIKGYFQDMNILFKSLYNKLTPNGLIFFNVANSAYYGVEIKTDLIIAEIAESNGFIVREIREARQMSPSSQQKEAIPYLRESVIVMIKPA